MADYLALLRELAPIEPPLFVFGGIADAILLDGRLGPSHGDIDVLTPRNDLERTVGQLRGLGFDRFNVFYEPRPGLPLVYGSTRGHVVLELSLLDVGSNGEPYFVVQADEGAVAVALDADLFEWPPTAVGDVPVRTLSPLALVQIRAAAMTTGAFGPTRPQDTARQARLLETFFPDDDPASLAPRITPVGNAN